MNDLLDSLRLLNVSGILIICVIVLLLIAAIITTFATRARYDQIASDLRRGLGTEPLFKFPVLTRIFADARQAAVAGDGEVNSQGIVEHAFQLDLRGSLIAERFVKASGGLLIILGLVGTFYGLTHSIGKLAQLISGDGSEQVEVTTALAHGLTEALSGMSIAFTTSLFGIVAAIVMTFVGVFASVTERRTALMVQLETQIDTWVARIRSEGGRSKPDAGFSDSVEQLRATVGQFESALHEFAGSTREFQEFNRHLKDNVQRLSLCFADLSDTLKEQLGALRQAPPRAEAHRPLGDGKPRP